MLYTKNSYAVFIVALSFVVFCNATDEYLVATSEQRLLNHSERIESHQGARKTDLSYGPGYSPDKTQKRASCAKDLGCGGHHKAKKDRSAPLNLSLAKEQVEYYYECGNFNADLDEVTHKAMNYFKMIPSPETKTIIFDIDDTALSDYGDDKSISFGYIPKLFHEWVLRADAPAIPQVKKLYDFVVALGFKIIFITGRKHNERDATIKNLQDQGYTVYEQVILRAKDEAKMTAEAYKTKRRKMLTQEGYEIVGSVGDQWSDLLGGYIGGYGVKIPNYQYIIR